LVDAGVPAGVDVGVDMAAGEEPVEVAGLAVDAGVCPPIDEGDIIEGDDPDIMGDPDMPGDIIMGDPDMPGDFIIGDPDMGDPDMLLAGALAAPVGGEAELPAGGDAIAPGPIAPGAIAEGDTLPI